MSEELTVKGRAVTVPLAARGVARFHFDQLCRAALGAEDYLAIARRYHTLVLDGVPAMDQAMRNEARRFITLIDVLYDNRVRLAAAAEAARRTRLSYSTSIRVMKRRASLRIAWFIAGTPSSTSVW